MTKYSRSPSSAELSQSQQTEENLYELGLLSRPSQRTRNTGTQPPRVEQHLLAGRRRHGASSSNTSYSSQQSTKSSTTSAAPHPSEQQRKHVRYQTPRDQRIPPSFTARVPGAGQAMASMMNADRSRSRRERTFVGGECAACEELLEHTLRGERVLQFSCGHVAHEACFYEYIKESDAESQYCPTCDAPLGLDTFRGGSILDLSKLSNIVRSVAHKEMRDDRSTSNTPMPWDRQGPPPSQHDDQYSTHTNSRDMYSRNSRDNANRDSRDSQRMRIERLQIGHPTTSQNNQNQNNQNSSNSNNNVNHSRNNSGNASSNDYGHESNGHSRKHDYDLHAMETSVPGALSKDNKGSIPYPSVTVRSEFPTMNRSRQQQSLACLVTIEVPESRWQYDDLHNAPPVPPLPSDPGTGRGYSQPPPPQAEAHQPFEPYESPEELDEITEELRLRVDNWHGLEFQRFGNLRLHGVVRVGKDRQSWQELECYLFGEMLICVKEKKTNQPPIVLDSGRKVTRCTLKGSILIRKHLKLVQPVPQDQILTLNLSVNELPTFHLAFQDSEQLERWHRALLDLHAPPAPLRAAEYEHDTSGTDDDEYPRHTRGTRRAESVTSSYGAPKSATTAPTEYSSQRPSTDRRTLGAPSSLHVPVDIVVVIPVSSSMQGLKIQLLKDTLRFLVANLGERDRMGLVTFGSSGGGVPLVGMTTKTWPGWNKVLNSIKPVGQKSPRADVVEGANVAMDLLMQRRAANPISSIMLISDSSTSEVDSVDFVVQRAEAAKVGIYSFGLGLTHRPDSMIELSSRTKGSYVYVKDWMMLRECAAGVLGAVQSISHQNVKLKLKLPEGSPAKFVKINGALQTTKRATGRDAEASLGDLHFGDKRDILVQLAIEADSTTQDQAPQDAWESIVSGLEALGGNLDNDDSRVQSVEEVPILQADLSFGDLLREGTLVQLSRPSLLAITMLPASARHRPNSRPATPPIPPHPHIVQRRMELLTSDMLSRALTLVSRGQHDRAHHLLNETRTILKGLGKGSLPPLPPTAAQSGSSKRLSPSDLKPPTSGRDGGTPDRHLRDPSPHSESSTPIARTSGIDAHTMNALDAEIESSLEWINHPAVFSRDSRKAVLQAIGVISSQRAYTFRTAAESLWADRVGGVKRLTEQSREWREPEDDALTEE